MSVPFEANSSPDVVEVDPASFRDAANAVFYRGGEVFRGLDERAAADFEALSATDFFPRLVAEGKVIETQRVDQPDGGAAGHADGRPWKMVLRHERIPFVSYPYEWTFSMLADAAELHLEILLDAIAEGMTMKDGSAFNVQWRGSRPVFIDVASFERNPAGGPWPGYRQFCQTFLYPLLLSAHKGVPFQPWLRGSVEGISGAHLRRLMGLRDLVRSGVLRHVVLPAAMESRVSAPAQAVQTELRAAGFSTEITQALVRNLVKLVGRLQPPAGRSMWAGYRRTCTYTDGDRHEKESFVRQAATAAPIALAWDLGCNDGHYARVAAEHAEYVVAIDNDETVVDGLYQSLRTEGATRILPLVMNLADPSPGLGWRGLERRSLVDRRPPDLVLCLALVHHLAISANVPLRAVVDWLGSLGARVVIEFAGRTDPMVQQLLANKPLSQHADYQEDVFEHLLEGAFTVERRTPLPSGSRTMYLVVPHA